MEQTKTQVIDHHTHVDLRLDKALPLIFCEHSRSYFDDLFDQERIVVNGKVAKKSFKLSLGDKIEITYPLAEPIALKKQAMALDILFEDEDLLIINKPAGLVVHPAPGHIENTLVNGLLHYCDIEEGEEASLRPGIVHRLDKDTSGVLITCKTRKGHEAMSALFQTREIQKHYLAITLGRAKQETIEAPLARHKHFRQKMAVNFTPNAKSATTHVFPLYYDHEISLAKIHIITGRTHQIRVHMQYRKTPILGDEVYGYPEANRSFKAHRQYLHAYEVSFVHPFTKAPHTFRAPLAEDMAHFLKARDVEIASLLS